MDAIPWTSGRPAQAEPHLLQCCRFVQAPVLYSEDEAVELEPPDDGLLFVARRPRFDGPLHLDADINWQVVEERVRIEDGDVVFFQPGYLA